MTIDHSSQPNQVNGNEVIYQGIAQRSFKLQFTVAEHVEVLGAELINGMLTIELEKIVPEEKKPRTIEIRALISIVLGFFSSGTIFSSSIVNIPLMSSAPRTSTCSATVNCNLNDLCAIPW